MGRQSPAKRAKGKGSAGKERNSSNKKKTGKQGGGARGDNDILKKVDNLNDDIKKLLAKYSNKNHDDNTQLGTLNLDSGIMGSREYDFGVENIGLEGGDPGEESISFVENLQNYDEPLAHSTAQEIYDTNFVGSTTMHQDKYQNLFNNPGISQKISKKNLGGNFGAESQGSQSDEDDPDDCQANLDKIYGNSGEAKVDHTIKDLMNNLDRFDGDPSYSEESQDYQTLLADAAKRIDHQFGNDCPVIPMANPNGQSQNFLGGLQSEDWDFDTVSNSSKKESRFIAKKPDYQNHTTYDFDGKMSIEFANQNFKEKLEG